LGLKIEQSEQVTRAVLKRDGVSILRDEGVKTTKTAVYHEILFLYMISQIRKTFLSGIYEHASWLAQELVKHSDGSTSCKLDGITIFGELANSLKQIVDESSTEKKLALLWAHPDLAAKVESMRNLTASSQEEQSSAGLQSLTPGECQKFTTLNTAYKTKFHFPFILKCN